MSLIVRDVQTHELDAILALNNAAGSTILPLDGAGIARLADHASYLRVAEADGQIAGFLLALREGTQYESPNYRWFSQRYPEFVYIDRIVIARPFRASRSRPRVLRGRDELRRGARAGADLRGIPRAARRHLGAVPRHLRVPGSRPADDARRAPARRAARQGPVQLSVRARFVPARRRAAGRCLARGAEHGKPVAKRAAGGGMLAQMA